MKNKLITIFAVIGAVAAIAGGVAYLLKVKKELDEYAKLFEKVNKRVCTNN